MKNQAYVGEKVLGDGRIVAAVWPGIVDRDTFDRVQDLMKRNGRTNRNVAKQVRHVHILSHGLLKCGRCDGEMQGRSGTGRSGTTYFYYACTNPECRLRVVSSEVEAAVIERIGVLASAPELVDRLTIKANATLLGEQPEIERRIRTLRRSLKAAEGDATSLAKALVKASSEGTAALNEQLVTSGQRRREIEDAIVEAEGRLAQLRSGQATTTSIRTGLANFGRVFAHLQPFEQRELVRLVLKQAQIGDRELVLELYGGALGAFEGKEKANRTPRFAEPTIWLPDVDSNHEHRG